MIQDILKLLYGPHDRISIFISQDKTLFGDISVLILLGPFFIFIGWMQSFPDSICAALLAEQNDNWATYFV